MMSCPIKTTYGSVNMPFLLGVTAAHRTYATTQVVSSQPHLPRPIHLEVTRSPKKTV